MAIDKFKNEEPNLPDIMLSEPENSIYKPIDNVYFVFIDVLGFKYTYDIWQIQNKDSFEDADKLINKYREVFNYYFELMFSARFMQSKKCCYAGQTSDSLYFYTERIDYLIDFIKIFSVFNRYAMSKDVFFRGGIAQGQLFRNKPYQFYGDSVIHAYLLESEIAQKPTVYFDVQTGRFLYEKFDKSEDIIDKSIVGKEKDSRYFLKPFNLVSNDDIKGLFDSGINLRQVSNEGIKDTIAMNKERFEYQPKTYMKYIFLENEFTEYEKLIKTKK